MVQPRRRSPRRSTRDKEGKGCFCCSEKTKCSSTSVKKERNDIENEHFVNQKNCYTNATKKLSGRKSPISSSSVLRQRRNSNLDSRTPQDCVVLISDWLRQQNVGSVDMDDSSSDAPSTSSPASQPQEQEEFLLQETASPEGMRLSSVTTESMITIPTTSDSWSVPTVSSFEAVRPPSVGSSEMMRSPSVGSSEIMRPPSVSSSLSAPLSPDSPSPSVFSQGGSSSGQESEIPSTSSGKSGTKSKRTPQRREKQRIASAKSRRKKKGEGEILKEKAEQLEKDNFELEQEVERLTILRKRYMDGEFACEYDDSLIKDPYDDSDDDGCAGAGAMLT